MTDHPDSREKATDTLEKAEREMRAKNAAAAQSDERKEASRQADGTTSPNPEKPEAEEANPPRTTSGWLTTPKFGSSTSGGGEIEPGPERD